MQSPRKPVQGKHLPPLKDPIYQKQFPLGVVSSNSRSSRNDMQTCFFHNPSRVAQDSDYLQDFQYVPVSSESTEDLLPAVYRTCVLSHLRQVVARLLSYLGHQDLWLGLYHGVQGSHPLQGVAVHAPSDGVTRGEREGVVQKTPTGWGRPCRCCQQGRESAALGTTPRSGQQTTR